MTEKTDQRICIRFCQKLGESCKVTYEKLQIVYGEECMSQSQVYEWFKRFKDGRDCVESDKRSGRPSTSKNVENIEKVRQIVRNNRRLTIREIAEDLDISVGSVQSIISDDLNMKRVSAKFVPKLLTPEQKHARVAAATDLVECDRNDRNFIHSIITGDETWVYGYDPETKAQSSQWKSPNSPRPKKTRQSRSVCKTLLTVFFDIRGIVHHEFAPHGQTVTKEYYREVLRRLRDAVRRRRPMLHQSGEWRLHHDNAPAHTAQLVQQFLAKHNIIQVPQPPYSPDMAPCDFFLFPKTKYALKGRRFQDVEEIMQNATKELYSLTVTDFERCFEQWKHRWNKCIAVEGEYFEGDKV